MPAGYSVFISYATDTKPFAEALSQALEEDGFRAWADFKDLHPGDRWIDEVERALISADSVLILTSPRSETTPWLEAEWQAALRNAWDNPQKVLIPIVIDGAEPPPFLRDRVALMVASDEKLSAWTPRVLAALRSSQSRTGRVDNPASRHAREQRLLEIDEAARALKKAALDAERPIRPAG